MPALPFHPLIQSWFTTHIGAPTDIQSKAWPEIAAGRHVLVTAPTGSGKTLTAFLWAIHQLTLPPPDSRPRRIGIPDQPRRLVRRWALQAPAREP